LFTINPGPHHRICDSRIWKVDEERLRELGSATDFNRKGDCEIYFYAA
jgi:hypothetical protein